MTAAPVPPDGETKRIHVSWTEGRGYTVSEPNWNGGDVIAAEDHDRAVAAAFAAGRAADRNTEGVWPDQSAMHGVLLDQIKDAYAEGIADTIDRLRVRAAEMLPEVARFTLDEIEVAAADLLASSTAEKLASPRKHSASASDPMPLCDCEWCARPLRDHDEEEAG